LRSTWAARVAESSWRWEVPELIAAIDPGIAARLLAAHPASGWCRSCRAGAPCSTRTLAVDVGRVVTGLDR
jgi:hypothetical protein